ncbi:fibrous sheath-interacting protein 1 [Trichomycterus rosablanca]|uniref:fibrous sheath-interacting protein 1 n=1 Tax=Trichomycterus rosablanca TaxID=2290929 RepID=UPI002F3592BA
MEITKGNLDDISRPASCERSRPGSRVSNVIVPEGVRVNQSQPGALEVLSSQSTETQDESLDCPLEDVASDLDTSDEENEDPKLLEAIRKMKSLDRLLAIKMSNEKEVKRRGRELHQRLWQELEDLRTNRSPECSDEAENTRLFLALTSSTSKSCSEEVEFESVFGTQVPDQENDPSCRNGFEGTPCESEDEMHSNSSSSAEGDYKVGRDKQTDTRQTAVDKNKHRQDFVKKNIELASGAGSLVLMTQEEKERLDELLKDLDEEGVNVELSAKPETDFSLCAVPTTPGEGYTPQPFELDQLLHIDTKLQLLLPVEKFLSVRSSFSLCSISQGRRGEEPGERVLRDMKETRGQEESLREIQQQLEQLAQSQHTARLSEEQMRNLLLECEMALSTQDMDELPDSRPLESGTVSLLVSTPTLSSSALSELLLEACGSPITPDLSEEARTDNLAVINTC